MNKLLKKLFTVILFFLTGHIVYSLDEITVANEKDSLYYKNTDEKLSIKFSQGDFKRMLVEKVSDTSFIYRKTGHLFDSITKIRLTLITESELNDHEIFGEDALLFYEIIHKLVKEKKVTYRIGKEYVSGKEIKIKIRNYSCCTEHRIKKSLFKRGAGCSRKYEFHYKGEISGTLLKDLFPKLINCF